MCGGGSGECWTTHVKFMVLPVLMNSSGPPSIVVSGSAKKKEFYWGKLDNYKKILLRNANTTDNNTISK